MSTYRTFALNSYLSNQLLTPRAVSCGPSRIHRSPIVPYVHTSLHDTGSFSPIQSLIFRCTRIGLLDPVPSHATHSNGSRRSSSPKRGLLPRLLPSIRKTSYSDRESYSASRIRLVSIQILQISTTSFFSRSMVLPSTLPSSCPHLAQHGRC